ncbi:MAG TPA: hypothetical protein PLN18_01025 [Candidatus Colwellbacteria bacterium]|nr:hypothetical protein [Candidatus Colwellbacteria bacterium]HQA95937.1 hypothetical protein [Candidatus Colwellbacteria bacterium]
MEDWESLLSEAESIIEITARRFDNIDGYDYEDLLQIGRIKVWEILSEKKGTFAAMKGYIAVSLANLFRTEFGKTKAAKRINLRQTTSLDAKIDDDDDRTRYDFIPDKGGAITLETLDIVKTAALKTKAKRAIRGVVWCLMELLGIRTEQAPKKINYGTFVKYGLSRYLWVFFNNSPYRALRYAYPELKAKDMKKRPNNYWKGERGKRKAVEELREILLSSGYGERDYPLVVNHDFIVDHGLSFPLQTMYGSSPFLFLDAVFPGRFHPWEMATTPKYWFESDDRAIAATKWLVEEVLGFDIPNLDEKEIWRRRIGVKIRRSDFDDNGLRGLISQFGNSPKRLLELAYPGKFQEWDFQSKDKNGSVPPDWNSPPAPRGG